MRLVDTITATMTQGGDEATFKDTATAVKDCHIVTLRTRKTGKSKNGKNVVSNDIAFNSCFVELQNKAGITIINAPLTYIHQLSVTGDCKGLVIDSDIDFNNSKIRSYNSSILTTGEVIELLVEAEK